MTILLAIAMARKKQFIQKMAKVKKTKRNDQQDLQTQKKKFTKKMAWMTSRRPHTLMSASPSLQPPPRAGQRKKSRGEATTPGHPRRGERRGRVR